MVRIPPNIMMVIFLGDGARDIAIPTLVECFNINWWINWRTMTCSASNGLKECHALSGAPEFWGTRPEFPGVPARTL